jgi:hypothetical protein
MPHFTSNFPFDPRRHITARQLRKLGFILRENIPDRSFISRHAVGFCEHELLDDGTASLGLIVLQPFELAEQFELCGAAR